ncbi:bHLH-MYC and R2R3-MYB transcription factor domain containing protein [Nitzschia inconspicua]|uniref:BHLH-MYC and R2R3-MYB transcription factor domain containing protein n=1 Tax=Nitzschia inconspicua TaxID=303405 RepID=A0A9K3KZ22_9STRA|nr:bHLH-MYC and R2R3-MYB transcription factor domain containing protein [Nitzschia inconspicua]
MDPTTSACKLCRAPGCELRLLGCGCTIHARCVPMSLVLDIQGNSMQNFGTFPPPNNNQNTPCPICCSGIVTGIYVTPLNFDEIERAIALKKASGSPAMSSSTGKKHGRDEDPEIEAHSTYLLLSNKHSSFASANLTREQQRTGRWTDEEIAFVDFLVNAFDNGSLPLPHGVKLNEFLGDVLLCKSSRLTKKMKNAKLSARSYLLGSSQVMPSREDRMLLSNLQDRFLSSISSESTRLELRFNLSKQWRTHFSNLCLQVGYQFLDAKDWMLSLEGIEARATEAEDAVRRVRRRKMSEALQTDGSNTANPSVFIGGVKADDAATQLQPELSVNFELPPVQEKVRTISADRESTKNFEDSLAFLNENGTSFSSMERRQRSRTLSIDFLQNVRDRTFSDDFDAVLNTLIDEGPLARESTKENKPGSNSSHSCGPFLDAIIYYMETHNTPFQHADLWVPSFDPQDGADLSSKAIDTHNLRLHHAGHASRGDLDDILAYKLHEFGVYSDNFSFEPGHGLPGRVYVSGQISWERHIQDADPKIFERVGGARVYGLRTAVGIPLETALVGRIVVTMYSSEDVPENMPMARDCASELAKYAPEPKWKLCIDTNPSGNIPSGFNTPMQLSTPGFLDNQDSLTLSPMFEGSDEPSCVTNTPSSQGSRPANPVSEEQQLISLLGLHMPVDHNLSSSSRNQLQLYMSIRLLLLRPASRRTAQENEMLEILKNSFRAYSKDSRRDGKELARLLVKDWECLQATYSFQTSTGPLPSPAMSKNIPPFGARQMSVAVERRLSSEPIQRRISSSSVPQGFLPSPTSTFSLNGSNQSSTTGSLKSQLQQFGQLPQIAGRSPAHTQPQLNHTRYMPQAPNLNTQQYPCDQYNGINFGIPAESPSIPSDSPSFQPQSVLSEARQDQSMNPVSPVTSGTQ